MPDRAVTTQWLSSREALYDLRQQPVVSLTISALIGILAEQSTELGPIGWLLTVSLMLFLCIHLRSVDRRQLGWSGLLAGVAIGSAFLAHSGNRAYESSPLLDIATQDPQPCVLRARIRRDLQMGEAIAPDYEQSRGENTSLSLTTEWQTQFTADVLELRQSEQWAPIQGGIKVVVEAACPQAGPGDIVELSGDLTAIKPPANPGESDLRKQARNRHYHALLVIDSDANFKIVRTGSWSLARCSYRIAQRGEQTLKRTMSEQTFPLASALVLGRRSSLAPSLKDQLLETGTIHLLSVSGLHLGVVAVAMIWLSTILNVRRLGQALLVAAASILFASVTGANPPVMRAALLVGTVLVAHWAMRRHSFFNTLAFAALILLLLNPTNLTQVGVQLSFLSVATLSLATRGAASREVKQRLQEESIAGKIESLIQQTRPRWIRNLIGLREHCKQYLWYSACVTMVTTPLTWLHFNILSFISVLANLLLTLPASIALIMGLMTVSFGAVWEPLGYLPALGCELTLRLVMWLVQILSAIPFSHAWLPTVPGWWVALYYLTLVSSVIYLRSDRVQRLFVYGSLTWLALGFGLAILPSLRTRDAVQATFVDVTHGTSVLLELPGGANVLYDCGRIGNFHSSSRGIEDVLWDRGIRRLDAVVLSHADSDHYNALPGLLHRFTIAEVIVPPGLFENRDPALVELQQALKQMQVPIREVAAGERFDSRNWQLQAIEIQVLHPPRPPLLHESDNANSLCLLIQSSAQQLLLPGDIEPPGTQLLVSHPRPKPGGVLMAPHHGSLSANSEAILDWYRPRQVIVSGGPRARNPRVKELLQYRGSEVHITANEGAIRVRLDQPIEVRSFLKNPW